MGSWGSCLVRRYLGAHDWSRETLWDYRRELEWKTGDGHLQEQTQGYAEVLGESRRLKKSPQSLVPATAAGLGASERKPEAQLGLHGLCLGKDLVRV